MNTELVGLSRTIVRVLFRRSIHSLALISFLVGLLLVVPMSQVDGFLDAPRTTARTAMPVGINRVTESSTTIQEETRMGNNECSSNDAVSSKQHSLRRQIPYVETFDEQIVRELWEKDPFDGNQYVVDSVIAGSGTSWNGDCGHRSAILTPVTDCYGDASLPPTSLSGYEDSFDPLYEPISGSKKSGTTGDSIRDDTHIVGETTASVAASEFVWSPPKNPNESEKMQNFFLRVAYNGNAFCGWQTQLKNLDQPSVQRTLEEWLTELQNNDQTATALATAFANAENHAERKRERRLRKQEKIDSKDRKQKGDDVDAGASGKKRREKSSSPRIKWADLPVAGRTDRGVSAIGQVCRFRTHRKDLTVAAINEYLTGRIRTTPGMTRSLGITEIAKVSRAFHPTFSTSCRAYAYIIDVTPENVSKRNDRVTELWTPERTEQQVALLSGMLQKLEGKALDYVGVSYGKVKTLDTICTLHHARAKLVQYNSRPPSSSSEAEHPVPRTAVCIELVGNRFLRRMVRLLVEASLRLVALAEQKMSESSGANGIAESVATRDALLNLIEQRDRTMVGRPSPPDGLIFVGARLSSLHRNETER